MILCDYLDFHARERGEAICLVQDNRTLTYAQLRERVNRLANALLQNGLVAGDRVAMLSKNAIEMVLIYLAGARIGVVPVPLNWRLAPAEWQYILDDAGAKVLFAETEFCTSVETVRAELISVMEFIAYGESAPSSDWQMFETWCRNSDSGNPDVGVDENDILYQMYTSGTTGRPKGALLTHRSVITNGMQCMPYFPAQFIPGKRVLIVMPMFHAGGVSTVFGTLNAGACCVIHRDFSPHSVADALSGRGITMVNLVPAMIQAMLLEVPDIAERDYSALDAIVYGASAIAVEVLRNALEVFQCDFAQGYGQTEASACLTFLAPEDHQRALADNPQLLLSAGRAVLGTELRIVDNRGAELPAGSVGEVVARGPQIMQGYWNLPEATEKTLVDGWLYTGDAGYLDEDGYLYIQDRVKDMVVSGGENIYPREVEEVLYQYPGIAEAAVIGVPDKQYGEALLAVIVAKEGEQPMEEDLIAFCRERIAGYKVPRQFKFVDVLPRNPSGKVLKKDLRAPYWDNEGRAVS